MTVKVISGFISRKVAAAVKQFLMSTVLFDQAVKFFCLCKYYALMGITPGKLIGQEIFEAFLSLAVAGKYFHSHCLQA